MIEQTYMAIYMSTQLLEKLTYEKVLTFRTIGVNIIKDRAKTRLKIESKKLLKKLKNFFKKVLTKYDNLC